MSNTPNSKGELFCLYCQQINKRHTTYCQYCGSPLVTQDPQLEKELKQQEDSWVSSIYQTQLEKCLGTLPVGGLALFINGRADPLTFPLVRNLILGRDAAHTGEQLVDISQYSQLGHSVSRRHAAILPTEGGFNCSDLGSTNGTWLNKQLLEPGKSYQLQHGDQIRLGLLAVVVCFQAANTAVKRLNILIKGRNTLDAQPHLLRPPYLLMYLSPFLQALNELQEIIYLSLEYPTRDIYLYAIQEKTTGIAINLELNPRVLHIWQRHIAPWRDQYTEFTSRDRRYPIEFLEQAIAQLADQILATIAPASTAPASLVQRLEALLTILAVSPLEAHWTE